jgi:hypothetical protein
MFPKFKREKLLELARKEIHPQLGDQRKEEPEKLEVRENVNVGPT